LANPLQFHGQQASTCNRSRRRLDKILIATVVFDTKRKIHNWIETKIHYH
jgi:hypothetical protein